MTGSLDALLNSYRAAAATERQKATYFERLANAYLAIDPVQVEEYEDVWSWRKWTKARGLSSADLGIDHVAKLRNEEGFAAIQCKFYPLELFQRVITVSLRTMEIVRGLPKLEVME